MGNSQKRKQEGMDAEGSPPESVRRRTRRLRSQERVDQIRCAPCLCKSGFLGAQPRTLIVCGRVCLCRVELNGLSGGHVAHRACGLPRLALSSKGVTRGHLAASGDASVITAEAVGGGSWHPVGRGGHAAGMHLDGPHDEK